MKKSIKTIISFLFITVIVFSFTACEDMLEINSTQEVFEENEKLENPNDAFYILNGILADLQKLGDRYIIFGELRGDLTRTSIYADLSLKEIDHFSVSKENEYLDKKDYYNVINNCNYAIQKMDTGLVVRNEKVMMPVFAAIKAIRAWTYWQMVQIYGTVSYLDKPILNLNQSLASYPQLDMDQVVEALIKDITPYINTPAPGSDASPGFQFIPVKLLLGDLYLYQNKYAQAADMYYKQMVDGQIIISSYSNYWTKATFNAISSSYSGSYYNETIAKIQYNTEAKYLHSEIINLTYNGQFSLYPTQNFVDSMAMAIYCFAAALGTAPTSYTEGDLRGHIPAPSSTQQQPGAYVNVNYTGTQNYVNMIYKFVPNMTTDYNGFDPNNIELYGLNYRSDISVFRYPHLYLRYAEAVNRAGKPTLAFAVLKHGLNRTTVYGNDMTLPVVNQNEVSSGESWVDFHSSMFDQNVPTASRGRGQGISKDTHYFVIPDYTRYVQGTDDLGNSIMVPSADLNDLETAKQDSINWVELRILDEMAAETAFEGNRFFDLLRVSKRRPNHPEFMAEKVAVKYENPETMKSKLMNIENWFVK